MVKKSNENQIFVKILKMDNFSEMAVNNPFFYTLLWQNCHLGQLKSRGSMLEWQLNVLAYLEE